MFTITNEKEVQHVGCVLPNTLVHGDCLEVMEFLIKSFSMENETVLDFTFGSCSTGVAALNTNRKFIGIEMEEKYFDIGTSRMESV